MMEQAYRRRIEADLARWQGEGTITAEAATAIRSALGPIPRGAGVAGVAGIVGGLLIVAAILVFVAANWPVIPRIVRLVLLVGGILAAHGLGAAFTRTDRAYLADACAAFGAIVFGAAIGLVGQMYHLPSDFSGGFLIWMLGAFAGAVLTGSRGALAVALAAGGAWSIAVALDHGTNPHWAALLLWAAAAVLATRWDSASARHLAALFLSGWWIETAIGFEVDDWPGDLAYVMGVAGALMLGVGLALGARGPSAIARLGATHATYGALALAFAVAICVVGLAGLSPGGAPLWSIAGALGGAALAALAALVARRAGPALAALAILLALATALAPGGDAARWTIYALSLASMLALLLGGAVDHARSRLVAGWIGLGLAIATITWRVEGGLITRALFLACAGAAAILLAWAIGRSGRRVAR